MQNRFEARSQQHDSTPRIGCVPAASGGEQWHARNCDCATRCSGRQRQQVSVTDSVRCASLQGKFVPVGYRHLAQSLRLSRAKASDAI